MSAAVAVAADGVRVPLSRDRVRAVVRGVLRAERAPTAMISIAFVTAPAIARLNRAHLGHAGATDVLSFGFVVPRAVVGDIYIAPAVARRNARQCGSGVREELIRLVVHGMLHVLGHDHPDDPTRVRSPMWRRQEALVRRFVAG